MIHVRQDVVLTHGTTRDRHPQPQVSFAFVSSFPFALEPAVNQNDQTDDEGETTGMMGSGMSMPVIEDNNAFLMAMGEGSRIEIHAADAAKDSWTQINATAGAGDVTLTLAEDTGWQVGDRIAIAASGFDMDEAEERTIVAVSPDGRTITLDEPLANDHYGAVDSYDNGMTGADSNAWQLDMRAEVALLSRNVTIQGDEDSPDDGYGGHTMIMMGADMHIDGAEFTNMGQAGILGRYPLHWHMLGDAAGQYVTNSSIHHTYNKGMTIHGTQNTWVENNAIFETVGHSYYFEDGSEFGNVLMNNLGMNTRETESVEAGPIGSDHTATSTYWVTNPNNHLIDNHAGGSDHAGFWILSQENVEGISATVARYDDYVPLEQAPGQWVGNASHTNGRDGIFIGGQFIEATGERTSFDEALTELFEITDFTTYKNQDFGLWVRNGDGVWSDIKVADSKKGARFWGSNELSDSLIVGRSDNYEEFGFDAYHGWELYDMASLFEDVHFAGFSGDLDAAIANHSGFGRSTNNSVVNLTFEDDVAQIFGTKIYSPVRDGERDDGGSLMGGLHDLDGSLTGMPGAVITPGIIDVLPNENLDIVSYAFEGIAASGFNWTAGAVWNADGNYWLHPATSVIGKAQLATSGDADERVDFTITRTDNGARLLYDNETQGRNGSAQLVVDGSGGFEYVVAYPDGPPPTPLTLVVQDLPQGTTVQYRFRDLPDNAVIQGADEVGGQAGLDAADGSAWFRAANGDVVIRMYADRFLSRWSDSIDDQPFVSDEVYLDRVKIIFEPDPSDQPSGNAAPVAAPADYRADPDPAPLPERGESTSETVEDSSGLPLWSDPSVWGGGVPGQGDVVVIGPGQKVVLDRTVVVAGIIIHGEDAALVVEDETGKEIDLTADWVLVNGGALFQAGTEADPLDTDFTLTLTGDDQDFDLDVGAYLSGAMPNTVFAAATADPSPAAPVEETPVEDDSGDEPVPDDDDEIDTAPDGEVIYGSGADDDLIAGAGNDTAYGGDGADKLRGGDGHDKLIGNDGADLLKGNFGNDLLKGGDGNDRLTGNQGDDTLRGNFGEDTLKGGQGDDVLAGGRSDDVLRGNSGDDTLKGNQGDDVLKGGPGDDVLKGGGGDDRLLGGAGDDVMTGGRGANTFVFDVNGGTDRISDFRDGLDLIRIKGTGFDDLDIAQDGTDALISVGDLSISLDNTESSAITGADFIF
ncbi:MAG: G8 domain-containing protein [Pseudomonadota bacterium]